MVVPGLPERPVAAHPVPADEHVLDRAVQRVAEVQVAGDVRRRHADDVALVAGRPGAGGVVALGLPGAPASATRPRRACRATPSDWRLHRPARLYRQAQERAAWPREPAPASRCGAQLPRIRSVLVRARRASRRRRRCDPRPSRRSARGERRFPCNGRARWTRSAGRTKFAFTSSVVYATPAGERRVDGAAHRRVEQREREPSVDDADRVVVELGGLDLERGRPLSTSIGRMPASARSEAAASRRRRSAGALRGRQLRQRVSDLQRVVPGVRPSCDQPSAPSAIAL